MAFALFALLLQVPGALLRREFGVGAARWGCGVFAVDASLSLGFLTLVLLPLYLAGAPVVFAAPAAFGATVFLAVAGWWRGDGERGEAPPEGMDERAAARREALVFAMAVAVLLPAALAHSGANVDDWWDLSFVRGWIADGHFSFGQMALATPPGGPPPAVHPRFLWSVWLMLQTLVATVAGEEAWKIQGASLTAASIVLIVSAQAAIAHALARIRTSSSLLPVGSVAMAAAWIWGSDALPLFVRAYQDKLFAAFAMAPVLVALVIDASSSSRVPRHLAAAVSLAALALVSVHSLIFTMALFAALLVPIAVRGRGAIAWATRNRAFVALLAAPALYPVAQALWLALTFGAQGVSLATPDNPVVRAHLSLNRILAASTPWWIVHPGAVFGRVAVAALAALAIAWHRRADDAAARVLLALTVVPCVLLFVPGLAGLAGRLWVPWMLYRLGWMVPVAALLAYAFVALLSSARERGRRPLVAAGFALVVFVLAWTEGSDRLRRGMQEHPGQPFGAPVGAAAVVLEFLASQPGRAGVLAPPNFSELVPATTGKPVVAFPERGTLVFSSDEAGAYDRLGDRARFFSAFTPAAARDEIAARYGVRWAVLPRRQIASGSESAWLRRFGPEPFLATRAEDQAVATRPTASAPGDSLSGDSLSGWWSATREDVAAGLPASWSVVLDTRDYFVVERDTAFLDPRRPADDARAGAAAPPAGAAWLRSFHLESPRQAAATGDLLAAAVGLPASRISFSPASRYLAPALLPVWSEGPMAWEDAPCDAIVHVDFGLPCVVSAVDVLPHLPRSRRDVLAISVDGREVRAAARDHRPIVLPVDPPSRRSSVDVRVTSLVGTPVSLADVRVYGDRSSCDGEWPAFRRTEAAQAEVPASQLVALAAEFPQSGRPLVSLARRAAKERGKKEAAALLGEAVSREPDLVEGWIELGFLEDEIAGEATDADEAAAARRDARAAFAAAAHADSHSAWAAGCEAWSERRAGHPLIAMVHSIVAAGLDPTYADAWTILGYSLADIRLDALAERSLALAERIDPDRNWPTLARAEIAMSRRDPEKARAVLRAWIREHPFDDAVRAQLSQIAAAAKGQGDAATGEPSR